MTRARGRNPVLRAWARDERGAAAVEFALWAVVIIPIVASATDLGLYVFQRMQVKQAAQMAAQTAWHNCSPSYVPAVQNCPGLVNNMATAIQKTGLGSAVTLSTGGSGDSYEGYYCVDGTGALTNLTSVHIPTSGTATLSRPSTTCTGNSALPGDYVEVSVAYTYKPLFRGASVAALLSPSITETAWTRLK